jgi:hypothetical protein
MISPALLHKYQTMSADLTALAASKKGTREASGKNAIGHTADSRPSDDDLDQLKCAVADRLVKLSGQHSLR